jgi:hypothetical protein
MNDRDEFKQWQQQWRGDDHGLRPKDIVSRARRKSHGNWNRPRLIAITVLWTSGLLMIATYLRQAHENHAFLILAFACLIVAAWFGSPTAGPDPVTASPEEYLKLRSRSKTREFRRTSVAQLTAVSAVLIALVCTWFSLKHGGTGTDELLPMAVLAIAMVTAGILVVIRAKRSVELASLREFEQQFEHADAAADDAFEGNGNVKASAPASQPAISTLARRMAMGFPSKSATAPNRKRKRKQRRMYP